MPRRIAVLVSFACLVAACGAGGGDGGGGSEPPADPAGTVISELAPSAAIDFETGAIGAAEPDLTLDSAGNFVSIDGIASVGEVDGLASVTVFPTAGWVLTQAAARGTGFVVKSSESWAYAVFVEDEARDDGGRTIHWRRLDGIARVLVSTDREGFGAVTSADGGIACDALGSPAWWCGEPYPIGTTVRLEATAVEATNLGHTGCPADAMRSEFAGWSGGTCSGEGACTFAVSDETRVTASFAKTLDVLIRDPASEPQVFGTITLDAPSPSLGCDGVFCRYRVRVGTTVTAHANPSSGYTFSHWPQSSQPSEACDNFQMQISTVACQQVTDPACTFVVGDRYDRSCRGMQPCNSWGGVETVMTPLFASAPNP